MGDPVIQRGNNSSIDKETVRIFKAVFTTEQGQFALARILEQLKFLEECKTESDMALRNFATKLLMTIYWDSDKGKVKGKKLLHYVKRFVNLKRRTK